MSWSTGDGRRSAIRASMAMLTACLVGCVAHPGLPATSAGAYRQKSVLTAEAAQSAVNTIGLGLDALPGRRTTSVYLDAVVSDQEEILAGVTSSFSSITPPGSASVRLRRRVVAALDQAGRDVADVRVALRSGHDEQARSLRHRLDADAATFEELAR